MTHPGLFPIPSLLTCLCRSQQNPAISRLMSDYEVNLVNDSMQEFYVRFFGPAESA